MKGILLAGGSGSRLYPLTRTLSKQLLPVYDKPMIYYPLSTLMLAGIRDVLVISTERDTPMIRNLLGDGADLGIRLSYEVQAKPEGIPQAFLIGERFIGNDNVCLILGDNIFYGSNFTAALEQGIDSQGNHATVFAYRVKDPERYGVVEFDAKGKAVSLEEKPRKPRSNWAVIGIYFYGSDVAARTRALRPSPRGELEITDLNRLYLNEGRLRVLPVSRGVAWLDGGTHDSLVEATQFVQSIEHRQGLKIACLEEIAFAKGYIDAAQLGKLADDHRGSAYAAYLRDVLEEYESTPRN